MGELLVGGITTQNGNLALMILEAKKIKIKVPTGFMPDRALFFIFKMPFCLLLSGKGI